MLFERLVCMARRYQRSTPSVHKTDDERPLALTTPLMSLREHGKCIAVCDFTIAYKGSDLQSLFKRDNLEDSSLLPKLGWPRLGSYIFRGIQPAPQNASRVDEHSPLLGISMNIHRRVDLDQNHRRVEGYEMEGYVQSGFDIRLGHAWIWT